MVKLMQPCVFYFQMFIFTKFIQGERNRCRSFDNANDTNSTPKAGQCLPRPRTQTHSQIQRIKEQNSNKKKPPLPTSSSRCDFI